MKEKTARQQQPSALMAWVLASRPRTLILSVIPILLGTLLAPKWLSHMDWGLAIFALFSSFFIQIGTNLINDALDFKKGADNEFRLGPLRATQQGWLTMQEVLSGGAASFLLATIFFLPLIYHSGMPFLILLLASLLCGYCYTGGPMPLAYYGLGEFFVFPFFGLAAVLGPYYLQTGEIDYKPFLLGTQIGLFSTAAIAVPNLRDYVSDKKSEKRTLAVRFGVTFGRVEISCLILLPYILNLVWLVNGYYLAALLPLVTLPLAWLFLRDIWVTDPSARYNKFLFRIILLNMFFGILFILGYRIG